MVHSSSLPASQRPTTLTSPPPSPSTSTPSSSSALFPAPSTSPPILPTGSLYNPTSWFHSYSLNKQRERRRRKDIDKNRKWLTTPVFKLFGGLIILTLIRFIYVPFKRVLIERTDGYFPIPEKPVNKAIRLENEAAALPPPLPLPIEEVALCSSLKEIIAVYNSALTLTSNNNDTESSFDKFTSLVQCEDEASLAKLLGHFGLGILQVNTDANTNTNASTAPSASSHFVEVLHTFSEVDIGLENLDEDDLRSMIISILHASTFELFEIYRLQSNNSNANANESLEILNFASLLIEDIEHISLSDDSIKFYILRSSYYQTLHYYHEASESLKTAITLQNRSPHQTPDVNSYSVLCGLYILQGLNGAARSSCKSAVDSISSVSSNDGDDGVSAFTNSGLLEFRVGNYKEAYLHYMTALRMKGSNANTNTNNEAKATNNGNSISSINGNIGAVLVASGRYDDAETFLVKAVQHYIKSNHHISLFGGSTPAYSSLARLVLRSGRGDMARMMFEKALSSNLPSSESAGWHFGIALTYRETGDYKAAWDHMTKAITVASNALVKSDREDYREYRHLATAVHKLGMCKLLDERVDDKILMVEGLKRSNREDITSNSYILPADLSTIPHSDSKVYIIKPSSSSDGAGITIVKGSSAVRALNITQPTVVSEYHVNSVLHDGRKSDLRVYVLVSGVWPALRVYVHRKSTVVRVAEDAYDVDADVDESDDMAFVDERKVRRVHLTASGENEGKHGISFNDWVTGIVTGKHGKSEGHAIGVTVAGEYEDESENDEKDSNKKMMMLESIRAKNFENVWNKATSNIGKLIESSVSIQIAEWINKRGADVSTEPDVWKHLASDLRLCQQKLYGVDILIEYGGDKALGLLSPAKSYIMEVNKSPGIGKDWTINTSDKLSRLTDTLMMSGGDLADRGSLELVMRNYLEPGKVDKKLSQRLSWCVQEMTKVFCPVLFKRRTDVNINGGIEEEDDDGEVEVEEGVDDDNRREGDCDNNKLGFLAMELAVATFEYERKGGWELIYPLTSERSWKGKEKEGEEKGIEEEEEMYDVFESDAAMVKHLFVKWVSQQDKAKAKRRK